MNMKTHVQRFAKNERGRDLIVGDIHGHFTKLGAALTAIGFDASSGDRLFSVGDLVDRGPESLEALNFLTLPGVYAVAGNHEDMAIRWPNGNMPLDLYVANGGAWMVALDRETQREVASTLAALPVAIEIETEAGLVGIVHADCTLGAWQEFTVMLEDSACTGQQRESLIDQAQWSRDRIGSSFDGHVQGVIAVVVGHTPMKTWTTLGNVIYIDTMAWRGGEFTILDAATLRPVHPVSSIRSRGAA